MPFKKVGPNKYKSPSGRTMTLKQVRAYYAKQDDMYKKKKGARKSMSSGRKKSARPRRKVSRPSARKR